jgi:hypothetical protein
MPMAAAVAPPGETVTLPLMRAAAERFCARLQAEPGVAGLPGPPQPCHGPELCWRNNLFAAAGFRRAHVELLEIANHFAVVHVVVLPHLGNPQSIFGFDMIAGRLQATGIFLDYTPVGGPPCQPVLGAVITDSARAAFVHPRARPAWGSIFSPDFFAIRPDGEAEIRGALALAEQAFDYYLRHLTRPEPVAQPDPAVIGGQSAYARAQRRNPHTEKMLARFVGAAAARGFIEDVLFPLAA